MTMEEQFWGADPFVFQNLVNRYAHPSALILIPVGDQEAIPILHS
jgi:hypothetical protein